MAKNTTLKAAAPKAAGALKEGNPFVAITAILGAFLTGIIALVLVFKSGDEGILVPITLSFVLIGWIMAYYTNKHLQR